MDKFGRVASSRRDSSLKRQRVEYTFPMTSDGNYDFTNHKLCNIKEPKTKSDAANMSYVDSKDNMIREDLGKLGMAFHQFKSNTEKKNVHFRGKIEDLNNYTSEMINNVNERIDNVKRDIQDRATVENLNNLKLQLTELANNYVSTVATIKVNLKKDFHNYRNIWEKDFEKFVTKFQNTINYDVDTKLSQIKSTIESLEVKMNAGTRKDDTATLQRNSAGN